MSVAVPVMGVVPDCFVASIVTVPGEASGAAVAKPCDGVTLLMTAIVVTEDDQRTTDVRSSVTVMAGGDATKYVPVA